MPKNDEIDAFLSQYADQVFSSALKLLEIVLKQLSGITEQIDIPAKMIAYCYEQKYVDLICVIIPSKKDLKLGFNRGTELPDPDKLLEGTGKISRYIQIKAAEQIKAPSLKKLILDALTLYRQKVG